MSSESIVSTDAYGSLIVEYRRTKRRGGIRIMWKLAIPGPPQHTIALSSVRGFATVEDARAAFLDMATEIWKVTESRRPKSLVEKILFWR